MVRPSMTIRVAIITLALSSLVTGNVYKFNAQSHYEDHVLEKPAKGAGVKRPYIEFKVDCTSRTRVSFLLLKATPISLGFHIPNTDDMTNLSTTAQCDDVETRHHQQRIRNGEDVNTTNPATAITTAKAATTSNISAPITNPPTGNPTTEKEFTTPTISPTVFGQKERVKAADFDGPSIELENVATGDRWEYKCHKPSNILVKSEYTGSAYMWGNFECRPGEEEDRFTRIDLFKADYTGHWTIYIEAKSANVTGEIAFMNIDGFLSSEQYPLLLFYGLSGLAYLLMGLCWMVAMAIHHEDLLRLQFALCVVIFIGMLEFAFAYGDYDYWNRHGTRSQGLFGIAQFLHASKDTLARVLVLVVSMGYGVVKPRLNRSTTTQIGGAAAVYVIFATIYNVNHRPGYVDERESKYAIIAAIPLSVMDAICLWWIFYALHSTMKILVLRQNTVKLQLYERFRLLLAFFAVASIFFFIWLLADHFDVKYNFAWKNIWFEDNFKHVLFTVVLIGIMVLWRPSMNNSRYAYAALEMDLLEEEEEDTQVVPNFGSETLKGRTRSSRGVKQVERFDVEDELAWVEEHIPNSVLSNDNTIGSFALDSDEEIMETRLMVSKME